MSTGPPKHACLDARNKDTKALLARLDDKEKGLMERISTAEAIVAKELERIQSKAADEYDYDAAGETGVMSHGLNLNYILYFWQEFEN